MVLACVHASLNLATCSISVCMMCSVIVELCPSDIQFIVHVSMVICVQGGNW